MYRIENNNVRGKGNGEAILREMVLPKGPGYPQPFRIPKPVFLNFF